MDWGIFQGLGAAGGNIAQMFAQKYALQREQDIWEERQGIEEAAQAERDQREAQRRMEELSKSDELARARSAEDFTRQQQADSFMNSPGLMETFVRGSLPGADPGSSINALNTMRIMGKLSKLEPLDDKDVASMGSLPPDAQLAIMNRASQVRAYRDDLGIKREGLDVEKQYRQGMADYYQARAGSAGDEVYDKITDKINELNKNMRTLVDKRTELLDPMKGNVGKYQATAEKNGGKLEHPSLQRLYEEGQRALESLTSQVTSFEAQRMKLQSDLMKHIKATNKVGAIAYLGDKAYVYNENGNFELYDPLDVESLR